MRSPRGRGAPVRLHVFSEGTSGRVRARSSLSYLAPLNATLHLTWPAGYSPLKDTFHHMVAADALILAKSSLSWSAAFLSTGRVFAPFRANHRIERCVPSAEPPRERVRRTREASRGHAAEAPRHTGPPPRPAAASGRVSG